MLSNVGVEMLSATHDPAENDPDEDLCDEQRRNDGWILSHSWFPRDGSLKRTIRTEDHLGAVCFCAVVRTRGRPCFP